jgi:arylsulfatase A-like enzyme
VDTLLARHAAHRPEQPLCLVLADNNPHVTWEKNKVYDPARLPVPPNMVDTEMTRKALANYYQDITTMDRRLGKILASVKKHGYYDNTLFIYTSDQGSEWPHCKWTVYDTGIRVPFIARWPGKIEPGSVCAALVSFVDVTPTFIDLAGGTPPGDLDGRSFKEVLLGETDRFREVIFASHTGDGKMNVFPQRGARDTRYKYVLNLKPENEWTTHFTRVDGIPESHKAVWDTWIEKAQSDREAARLVDVIRHHPREELYDTRQDPYELNNLAGREDLQPVLERLRDRLQAWRRQQGEPANDF